MGLGRGARGARAFTSLFSLACSSKLVIAMNTSVTSHVLFFWREHLSSFPVVSVIQDTFAPAASHVRSSDLVRLIAATLHRGRPSCLVAEGQFGVYTSRRLYPSTGGRLGHFRFSSVAKSAAVSFVFVIHCWARGGPVFHFSRSLCAVSRSGCTSSHPPSSAQGPPSLHVLGST